MAQIDRRLRELRGYGWQIATYRDDAALKQEEYRYVARGQELWLPGQAKASLQSNSLTAPQRIKVWQADNFLCRTCGVGTGESYDDGVELSKLNIARRKVRLADGVTETQLVTECKRCHAGRDEREVDLGEMLSRVHDLAPLERKVLAGWIEADRRTPGALERLWGNYRTLPERSRRAIAQAVAGENE
ncbi:hypothetical protein [Saccharothrix sp. ST-888]|uniref:hypothetical protein n=1 Tax=Saccharothrix sp. ST-888 TaxID=1427391 RepID=UPI0012DFE981|nr:hypothetical protein [Saccharothrix sp. ST-888]